MHLADHLRPRTKISWKAFLYEGIYILFVAERFPQIHKIGGRRMKTIE